MSHRRLLAAVVLIALPIALPAAEPTLPPDLAMVPPDALGFVHVRVGDLYRSEHFREARQLLAKAGEDALKAFNARFVPAPNSLDRVTVFVLPPGGGGRGEPEPVVIISTSAPFDRGRLLKSLGEGKFREDGNVAVDDRDTTAIFTPSNTLLAVGNPATIRKLAQQPAGGTGPLSPTLALAATGKPLVAGVNAGMIPAEALRHAPPPFQPYIPLLRAKLVTFVADFDKGTHLDLRLKYADARAVEQAELAAQAAVVMGRQHIAKHRMEAERKLTDPNLPDPAPIEKLPETAAALFALAALNQADEVLKTLPFRKDGTDLRLDVTLPPGPASLAAAGSAVSIGLLLPAVQKVREAAARTQGQNNLKQIGLALHNYASATGNLPAHAIYSKDGQRPLLSWRVAILPYIEQDALYRQFKLDEPWDSEHNKQLIAQMPKIYEMPNHPRNVELGDKTFYQAFVGPGAGWERQPRAIRFQDFTDGTSNTTIIAEASEPVTWTKPDDITFDPDKPLPKLGYGPTGFNGLFMDGSVRFIRATVDEKTRKALITRNGGEVVNMDF